MADRGSVPAAVADHLDRHPDITLFCRDRQGAPIGYPMRVAGRRGAELVFSTYRKSAKVAHLERDPRTALLSMAAPDPGTLRWVSMTGRAEVWVPTPTEIDELFAGAEAGDPRVPGTVTPLVRQRTLEGKRVLLRIALDAPETLTVEEARR